VLTGDLTGVNLSGANLSGTQFRIAMLMEADFSGANLRGAVFSGVNAAHFCEDAICWTSTKFVGADLTDAVFDGSYLDYVDFTDANLDRVRFSASSLWGTNWTGATARRSSGISLTFESIPSDLTGASFSAGSYVNWTNVVLTDAHITLFASGRQQLWSSGGGIVGIPAELPGWYRVIRGYMVGPDVLLGPIDLSGVDLRGLDLDQTDLTGANLRGANLSGVRISGDPFATFVGSRSSFRDADLTGANLEGAEFFAASFDGANLTGANLSRVWATAPMDSFESSFRNANLTGANLDGAQFAFASFEGANLTDANLSRVWASVVDFTGATLAGTRLSGAVFQEADFTGATGAPVDGANSRSIDYMICPNGETVLEPGTCWTD